MLSKLGSRWCGFGWVVLVSLWIVLAAAAGGCGPHETRFEIADHRVGGEVCRYGESFDECYYSIEPGGRFDIVARRISTSRAAADERITQVVHLRGIWQAVPGRTFAEDTMLNTTVAYMIVGVGGGASFEGGGFVSFRENRAKSEAVGALELAKLTPCRRLGDGWRIFERAELCGEFKATHNRRRVSRILTEMDRLFGPMPRYQPPPEPDVL